MGPVSSPSPAAREFVHRLAGLRFANAFNPYSDICDRFDLPDAPAIRRGNLELMLAAALRYGVEEIWVARDLSYDGGRRTGLPMTDEVRLDVYADLLGVQGVRRATLGPPVVERTSRVVWSAIQERPASIWLWNVFPLHPYNFRQPFSNRAHKAEERDAGLLFLDWLLAKVRWNRVVAIGRDAEKALLGRGIPAKAVRHPSHGGQRDFLSGIRASAGHV